MEAITSDKNITLDVEADELIIDLSTLQPKLHPRITANLKRRQLAYILDATAKIFSI